MYAIMWKNKEGKYEWQNDTVFDRQLWENRHTAEKALATFYASLPFSAATNLFDNETSDMGWRIVEIQKVHKQRVKHELKN